MKSWVHNHLVNHVYTNNLLVSATCKHCNLETNLRSGTNIAKSHLKANHPDKIIAPPSPKRSIKTGTLTIDEKKKLQQNFDEKFASWVAHDA